MSRSLRSRRIVASAAFIVIHDLINRKKKKSSRKRRHSILKSRQACSENRLLRDLFVGGQFENFCRMSMEDFEHLLTLTELKIRKKDTNYKSAISPRERLAITLRFLATGDSFTSLRHLFKVSKQSISTIVIEVCRALNDELKHYIKMPITPEGWQRCYNKFEELWDFPHCLGAADCKNVVLQAPMSSGCEYSNVVLFSLVDANYNFMFADVGHQGRISDGGVFENSMLRKKLHENSLFLPRLPPLPGSKNPTPYVILADQAFALEENVMKPYSGLHQKGSRQSIFNYRFSRARRVVENAFGILRSVFRVLRKPLLLEPEKAKDVVLTTMCLHNFLRQSKNSQQFYAPPGTFDSETSDGKLIEGEWRRVAGEPAALRDFENVAKKSSSKALVIRDEIAEYFVTKGSIPWQYSYA